MQKKLQNVLHTFFYYRKNGKIKKNARNKKKSTFAIHDAKSLERGTCFFYLYFFNVNQLKSKSVAYIWDVHVIN